MCVCACVRACVRVCVLLRAMNASLVRVFNDACVVLSRPTNTFAREHCNISTLRSKPLQRD